MDNNPFSRVGDTDSDVRTLRKKCRKLDIGKNPEYRTEKTEMPETTDAIHLRNLAAELLKSANGDVATATPKLAVYRH